MKPVPRGFALYDSLLAMLTLSIGLSPLALWLLQEARFVSEARQETLALWHASNAREAWSSTPLTVASALRCRDQPTRQGRILLTLSQRAAAGGRAAYGQVCVSWVERGARHLALWVALP